jgi:hypothetical protein
MVALSWPLPCATMISEVASAEEGAVVAVADRLGSAGEAWGARTALSAKVSPSPKAPTSTSLIPNHRQRLLQVPLSSPTIAKGPYKYLSHPQPSRKAPTSTSLVPNHRERPLQVPLSSPKKGCDPSNRKSLRQSQQEILQVIQRCNMN